MFNTVLELLRSRNYKAIREIFMDMNEADVAALLQQFYDDHEVEKYELPLLFRLLNKDVAADVFAYMDSDTQMMLINAFTDKELQEIVDDLYLDDTVDITDVVCPVTFVKAKVALEELDEGQILSIRMNDGEPVQNVPRSIKEEGHQILKLDDNEDGTYTLYVKKVED